MLRSLLLLAAFGLALTPASSAQERASDAPRVSPNAHVGQTFGFTEVDVTYGRPAINDRSLFADGSELAPYGEVWRAGANEATTVTFSTDVMAEGQPLEAGTYALFVVPGDGAWSVHFNREANQWGAFGHDPAQDAVVASIMPQIATNPVEQMQFTFADVSNEGTTLHLEWGTTRLPIRLNADFEGVLVEMGNAAATWQSATTYAMLGSQNDLDQAITMGWVQKAVEMDANFYTHRAHASILAQYGDYAAAVAAADAALAAAPAMEVDARNVSRMEAMRAEWTAAMSN